jgi:hypothetical protein
MLALDRPFISNFVDNDQGDLPELCLEYGSETQVYLAPFAQQEEQVGKNPLIVHSALLQLTNTKDVCRFF